jgi:hypothetical protein
VPYYISSEPAYVDNKIWPRETIFFTLQTANPAWRTPTTSEFAQAALSVPSPFGAYLEPGELPSALAGVGIIVPVTIGDVNAASANVASIQAALDAGGTVNVAGSGVAYTNATLRIGPNTNLVISPQLTIRQTPNTRLSMLRNKASYATQSAVTLSWTAGRILTIAWPSHGLSPGDFAWVKLASGSSTVDTAPYPGVFPVLSVTDANTIIVQMERAPNAAPTATYTATKADIGISVSGTFDYDQANQGAPGDLNTQAVIFCGHQGLRVGRLRVLNGYKYCVTFAAGADTRYDLIEVPVTRSDGIKLYGPLARFRGGFLTGAFGDDAISVQPREATGFEQYMQSEGICVDIDIGTINVQKIGDGASPIALYGHDAYLMDDVRLTSLTGENKSSDPVTYAERGVNVRANNGVTTGLIGRLQLRGVAIRANLPVSILNVNAADILVDLQEPRQNGSNTDNGNRSLVHVKPGTGGGVTSVRKLTVTGISTDPAYGSSANTYPFRVDTTVDTLSIDFQLRGNTSLRCYTQGSTATVGRVTFTRGCDITADHLATIIGAASAPEIVIEAGTFRTVTGVNAQVSCNVTLVGARFTNCTNGIVRAQGTAVVNFKSSGARLDAGVWVTAPSGTPVVNPQSEDIQIDVSAAFIGRPNGARAWNTNAALGTLASAGPVVSDGTKWVNARNTTLSYT